jgi:hypothetical protein
MDRGEKWVGSGNPVALSPKGEFVVTTLTGS